MIHLPLLLLSYGTWEWICAEVRNVHSLYVSHTLRDTQLDMCDLTFGDSELCWCSCHWNRKRCRFRKRASLAPFFFNIELKLKECFENPGDNWLTPLPPSVCINWIYYLHISLETWGLINACKTHALKKRSLFSYDFRKSSILLLVIP